MTFAIFKSSNPRPVPYTGQYLIKLDRFSKDESSPLATFILTKIMVFGAIFRMVADSARYTSHGVQDCWKERDVTPLALNSFAQSGRYLVMAVFTVALGFLSSSVVVKVADRSGMIPHLTFGSTLKTTAKVAIVFGAIFCVARAYMSSEEERTAVYALAERAITHINTWAKPVIDKLGESNTIGLGIAAGVYTSYKLLSYAVRSYFSKNHFSV